MGTKETAVVVLAAGLGTRMNSILAKSTASDCRAPNDSAIIG